MFKATIESIGHGASGLASKVRQIRSLVERAKRNPNFRARVLELVRNVPEKDTAGELAAVTDFVRGGLRYVRDPWSPGGLELFHTPEVLLGGIEDGTAQGDCDDHVILASAMLETIGYPTRYRVGGRKPDHYQHIWLEALDPVRGQWVPIELTKKDVPVGWDPSPRFELLETHLGGLPDAEGSEMSSNENLSRMVASLTSEPVFRGALPSDFMRELAFRRDPRPVHQGNIATLPNRRQRPRVRQRQLRSVLNQAPRWMPELVLVPQAASGWGTGGELEGWFSDAWDKVRGYVKRYAPLAVGAVATIATGGATAPMLLGAAGQAFGGSGGAVPGAGGVPGQAMQHPWQPAIDAIARQVFHGYTPPTQPFQPFGIVAGGPQPVPAPQRDFGPWGAVYDAVSRGDYRRAAQQLPVYGQAQSWLRQAGGDLSRWLGFSRGVPQPIPDPRNAYSAPWMLFGLGADDGDGVWSTVYDRAKRGFYDVVDWWRRLRPHLPRPPRPTTGGRREMLAPLAGLGGLGDFPDTQFDEWIREESARGKGFEGRVAARYGDFLRAMLEARNIDSADIEQFLSRPVPPDIAAKYPRGAGWAIKDWGPGLWAAPLWRSAAIIEAGYRVNPPRGPWTAPDNLPTWSVRHRYTRDQLKKAHDKALDDVLRLAKKGPGPGKGKNKAQLGPGGALTSVAIGLGILFLAKRSSRRGD